MEYRELGRTGFKVSVVGLGTLGFGRGGLFKEEGMKEITKIVNKALDLGINFIDTSLAYGKGIAETEVGEVMKARRKECVVLSRSHIWQSSENPEDFAKSFEESLLRLKMDTIDVYQVHDVTRAESYKMVREKGIYDVLKKAKREGRVKFIGFSTHGTPELMKEMINSGDVDVLTVAYNLTSQRRSLTDGDNLEKTSSEILPLAKKMGIGITIMKPFGGGVLLQPSTDGTMLSAVNILKYVVQNPYVDSVTPGVENLAQLEEIARAGDINFKLSQKEIEELLEKAQKWGRDFCRQCGYCLPCSAEIKIPEVMNLLRYAKSKDENIRKKVFERYQKLEVKADACTECKKCEEKCPYELPVSEKMKEIQGIFKQEMK